ncbi:tRNA (guanine-N(1)-)-methyltransferase [Mycoplasma wenyonii str. Massachusetts]|uniref:tRNA (Guanine-N(1)-)-methyltransferase n=1 Tax=Mycoplasma wenyonii (strain Massachusetts) TaxID=1197325 RepID=I6ZEZ6_MYCWM|nr:tRNA (guanine-N(1)-)-methyltransferase [Mycoplasma wenyonii str. Massachusetts]
MDFPACGGQGGMVISIEPIYRLLEKYKLLNNAHIILLCPRGQKLTQTRSRELEQLSSTTSIVFLCGHYEGIDERISHFISERLSIGDYIISSGTLAASVILEGIVRLIPGVISEESLVSESFNNIEDSSDFDFPCYAPPKNFLGYKIPENLGQAPKKKARKG